MFGAWSTDAEMLLMVFDLAKSRGKLAGDNCQVEFDEIKTLYPDRFKFLGVTAHDADMMTGELRDRGLKILNLKEVDRRHDNKKPNA